MSRQTFFFVLLLIGIQCFLSATQEYNAEWKNFRTNNNRPELGNFPNIPRHPIRHNETNWEKLAADAEIEHILFGENMNFQKCLTVTLKVKRRKQARLIDMPKKKPYWTVVVLEEVKLRGLTYNFQHCAGSLINLKVVLTAAHCMYNKTHTDLKVRAGAFESAPGRIQTPFQERMIESVVFKNYHPKRPRNDIALIFLKESFQQSPNIRLTCLPQSKAAVNIDYAECLVSGWQNTISYGATEVREKRLKKLAVTPLPHNRCEAVLKMTALATNFSLPNSLICASGRTEKNMLIGNGGAPLVCSVCGDTKRTIQVGVLSWGFNATSLLPEVFTATNSFYSWIKSELKKRSIDLQSCGIKWND